MPPKAGWKSSLVAADHPFHLECHQGADAPLKSGCDLCPRERPLAVGVDRAVLVEPIAGSPGPALGIAQDYELVQVGHHPQVPIRLVERRRGVDAAVADERVGNRREADARSCRRGKAVRRDDLDPRRSGVIDIGDRHPGDLVRELALQNLSALFVRGTLALAANRAERSWHGHLPLAGRLSPSGHGNWPSHSFVTLGHPMGQRK